MSKPKPAEPGPKFPSGVPSKFDPDGGVQRFRGNTILVPLSNTSELYKSLLVLHDRLKQSPLSRMLALLPPSSWHMTVFEGVVGQIRNPGYWPSDLNPLDATLDDVTALFVKKLSSFDLQVPLPFHMTVTGYTSDGLGLRLEPHPADMKAIQGLRDRLADLLKYRHPDHETYELHLSIAYHLRFFTEQQKAELNEILMDHFENMPKEFVLEQPEFSVFEDMMAFKPVLYLRNRTEHPN